MASNATSELTTEHTFLTKFRQKKWREELDRDRQVEHVELEVHNQAVMRDSRWFLNRLLAQRAETMNFALKNGREDTRHNRLESRTATNLSILDLHGCNKLKKRDFSYFPDGHGYGHE